MSCNQSAYVHGLAVARSTCFSNALYVLDVLGVFEMPDLLDVLMQ